MIKAVLLDIDDTLLDFSRCAQWSMETTARAQGVALPPGAFCVFTRINTGLWRDVEEGKLTNEELFQVRWNRIFAVLGVEADGLRFEKGFLGQLARSAEPVPGAADILVYLSSKYTICAASNGPDGQQRRRLERAGMLPYIRKIFTSEGIGHSKPRKEFFDACLAALGPIRPEEVMMIGDSLTADIRGARACGLRTCWYRPGGVRAGEGNCADCVVGALAEIRGIL